MGRHRSVNAEGNYLDVLIEDMKKDPHRLLTSILIGNTVINVAAACFATLVLNRICQEWPFGVTLAVAIIFVAVLILIFGELLPKALATGPDILVSLPVILPLYWLLIVLLPVNWVL